MARFTRHAYQRFRTRHVEPVPTRLPVDRHIQLAEENFYQAPLITREEAAARINGPVYAKSADFIFRADGTGKGVWVSCLNGGQEVVVTYLGFRPTHEARNTRRNFQQSRRRSG
ncbi:MAG: hypothetical protein ACM3XM_19100 [Mycobacterium leprae]